MTQAISLPQAMAIGKVKSYPQRCIDYLSCCCHREVPGALAGQEEEEQEACAVDEHGEEQQRRRHDQAQPLWQDKNVLLWLRRRELPHQARHARGAMRLALAQVQGLLWACSLCSTSLKASATSDMHFLTTRVCREGLDAATDSMKQHRQWPRQGRKLDGYSVSALLPAPAVAGGPGCWW